MMKNNGFKLSVLVLALTASGSALADRLLMEEENLRKEIDKPSVRNKATLSSAYNDALARQEDLASQWENYLQGEHNFNLSEVSRRVIKLENKLNKEITDRITSEKATLASANTYTDENVSTLRNNVDSVEKSVNANLANINNKIDKEISDRIASDNTALASAYKDTLARADNLNYEWDDNLLDDHNSNSSEVPGSVITLEDKLNAEINNRIASDNTTLASANAYTDDLDRTVTEAVVQLATTIDSTNQTVETLRMDVDSADKRVSANLATVDNKIAKEITDRTAGETATLASAKTYTDENVLTFRNHVDSVEKSVNANLTTTNNKIAKEITDRTAGETATLASANAYTDTVNTEAAKALTKYMVSTNETINANKENFDANLTTTNNKIAKEITDRTAGETATLASANAYTDKLDRDATEVAIQLATAIHSTNQTVEALRMDVDSADKSVKDNLATVDNKIAKEITDRTDGDKVTLASAKTYTDENVLTLKNNVDSVEKSVKSNLATFDDKLNTEIQDRIAGDKATLASANNYTNQSIAKLEKNYQAAIASSIAIASLPQPTEAGKNMVSFGTGAWSGQQGYALGVSGVTLNNKWVYKAAATADSRGKFGGGVSVGFQW